ncbi:protein DEK-like isoform X2 [Oncorhynchus clarkii lewisi]|uniref:protein DEK-like isoform X2 n=1 Tax=Oncorhynchus clarkii lewisi TaxID=490388 RepID=UPI0039B92954
MVITPNDEDGYGINQASAKTISPLKRVLPNTHTKIEIEAMRRAKIRRLMQRKTVLLSESDDDITDDSSDDEPLVKMMTRRPSNEELKTTVKKLGAHVDLEKVTMKDIFKKVFKMYPRHDLSNNKSYIKETVKKLSECSLEFFANRHLP